MDDGVANQRGFQSARLGQHKSATVAMRFQGHRQRTADRPKIAGQRQLARKFVTLERIRWNLSGGGENSQRDGQVEAAGFLR